MTAWAGLAAIGAIALVLIVTSMVAVIRIRGYKGARMAAGGSDPLPGNDYTPLARLLSGEDLEFLRSQRCGADLSARWNRSRRRLARLYLDEIAADFRHLHGRARALVAEAPEQYSELAQVLMRQQLAFWRAMIGIEFRLVMSRFGVGGMEARALLDAIEATRAEILRATAPATA